MGEKILEEGKADFIGMTRRLLADPELPNKIAQGKLDISHPALPAASVLKLTHSVCHHLQGQCCSWRL